MVAAQRDHLRATVAGMTEGNMEYLCSAIADVLNGA